MSTSTLRLHISPFSKDLFDSVLPSSVAAEARNISFHTLQTFPENNYGFVELPQPQAEKLKKKLHGAILRGQKMRVEDARPAKRRRGEVDAEDTVEGAQQTASKPRVKKAGKKANVVEGREVSPDRKIKRGWTQAEQPNGASGKHKRKKDKTNQSPSKYSEHDEVLFRTKVPPNKVAKSGKKSKKRKQTSEDADLETVHEFKKSTKQPTFLKATASSSEPVSAYEEGKGWVDKDGTVVEAENPSLSSRPQTRKAAKKTNSTSVEPVSNDQDTESTSSSGSDEEDSDNSAPTYSQPESAIPSPTPPDLSQSTTPPTVHPLEALFKVPSKPTTTSSSQDKDTPKPSLELSTSFHFFSKDNKTDPDLEDEEEEPASIPLTPYSSQDFRSRTTRSAAPTPDTAHPSRLSSYERNMPPAMRLASRTSRENDNDDDEDDEEDEANDNTQTPQTRSRNTRSGSAPVQDQEQPESEFAKQFWEKRGENDRAWKARRRESLRERRKAENKDGKRRGW